MTTKRKKVGILFSGGPAPSANTVISSTSLNFIDNGVPVIGFIKGYENIQNFDRESPNIEKNVHYIEIDYDITQVRNERGVFLKTSRANPGKNIMTEDDLKNNERNLKLRNIINCFEYLNADTLISIGGDDTLKTANYLWKMGLPVLHIPKTIDNDYYGIPWTFGYWTAVDTAQKIMLNLKADAQATESFYIVELMGRKTGWITYATGIASDAIMMISNEDIDDDVMDVDKICERITNLIIGRRKNGRPYGVIAISEGLADKLPEGMVPKETDRHGNVMLGKANVGRLFARKVADLYTEKTGIDVKIIAKQIGYETRAAAPISFDVVLSGMLGYGAFKFYHEKKFGVMVSVSSNFDLVAVPFDELIDPHTLKTKIRNVPKGSDFYTLKENLSFRRFKE
ncbi:MAG: 6-phosphofructokinase [Spirochaetes bacterium]|nr:6-phosphofructokinase [Spirochaetota bacterium]